MLTVSVVERPPQMTLIPASNGSGFPLEAARPVGIGGELRRQHLDRDNATQARVASAVDLAHAPESNLGADLVRTEVGARLHVVVLLAEICTAMCANERGSERRPGARAIMDPNART